MTGGLAALRNCLFWVSAPLFFITFALPVRSKELGASALEVGGLFSLFTLSVLIFRPFIGYALDQFGRRKFLLLSVVLYFIAHIGYSFAEQLSAMYAARFLQGMGAALLLLTADAITADLTDFSDRAAAMGKNLEAQTRATFIGAGIGFGLVAAIPEQGWQMSFGIFAAFTLYALVTTWRKLPETLVAKDEAIDKRVPPEFFKLMIWLVPIGFASSLIMPIYLVYLADAFTTDKQALSIAFLPAGLVFAILPAKLGTLADQYGARTPIFFSLTGLAFLYVLMPKAANFWLVVGVYTLSSVGWALIEPARKSLTAHLSGGHAARGFGLAEMAFGAGAVVGPLAGGYMYDQFGVAQAFYLNAAVMLLALVMLLVLVPKAAKQTVST